VGNKLFFVSQSLSWSVYFLPPKRPYTQSVNTAPDLFGIWITVASKQVIGRLAGSAGCQELLSVVADQQPKVHTLLPPISIKFRLLVLSVLKLTNYAKKEVFKLTRSLQQIMEVPSISSSVFKLTR